MICPVCLDEYVLLDFDVDHETLEHRGLFKCGCDESVLFPEYLTRTMIADEDSQDRLRLSRLFHLSQSVGQLKAAVPTFSPFMLRLKTQHLHRYLQDVSEQSLRQLK
jgi:hypothetical protein